MFHSLLYDCRCYLCNHHLCCSILQYIHHLLLYYSLLILSVQDHHYGYYHTYLGQVYVFRTLVLRVFFQYYYMGELLNLQALLQPHRQVFLLLYYAFRIQGTVSFSRILGLLLSQVYLIGVVLLLLYLLWLVQFPDVLQRLLYLSCSILIHSHEQLDLL